MGLREQAAGDLQLILEDASSTGAGIEISLTNPSGQSAELVGSAGAIFEAIDPETQTLATSLQAHVVLSTRSLQEAGIGTPRGIADKNRRPWTVRFTDVDGRMRTYKVLEVRPDEIAGAVKLTIEQYKA